MKEFISALPGYDFLYLGDSARTPYGTRSFESVYEFTLEGVKYLFNLGCHLVILACNTASAKALRTIQQQDLSQIDPNRRVLGVIRPTTEQIGAFTKTGEIGIFATSGTVQSGSYKIEIRKFSPQINVYEEACPMWVPLVENGELDNPGADYFVKKHLNNLMQKHPDIDTILLACTHYPLLIPTLRKHLKKKVKLVSQGPLAAERLGNYLQRHPEIDIKCSKKARIDFLTTDNTEKFNEIGGRFFGSEIESKHVHL